MQTHQFSYEMFYMKGQFEMRPQIWCQTIFLGLKMYRSPCDWLYLNFHWIL